MQINFWHDLYTRADTRSNAHAQLITTYVSSFYYVSALYIT